MADGPTFEQPNWQPNVVYNVAGNLNQGAPAMAAPTSLAIIPFPPNQVFVGRDTQLRQLDDWLERPGAAVVIAGLGGVGKTQLAAEYAHACAADAVRWPAGVAWVSMSDPSGIGTAVSGAGYGLGIPGYAALPLPEQIAVVQRAWAGPERRLLVFDNCEDPALLKQWRPASGGARVIVTARRMDWPPAATRTLRLGELPRAAALELLVAGRAAILGISPDGGHGGTALQDDPDADAICAELGDLALAIHMASAYLAARPHAPLAGYLADLRAQSIDHASLRTLDDSSPTEHLHHVGQTFALSYALLGDDRRPTNDDRPTTTDQRPVYGDPSVAAPFAALINAQARHILDLAAHCAPGAPIPLDLLRRAAATTDDQRPTTNDEEPAIQDTLTDDAIQRLVAIGLASYSDEGRALAIHKLVAAYARREQGDTAAALADTIANVLRWITQEVGEAGLPANMLPLLSHAQHVADKAEARGSEYAATLLNNIGSYFQDVANLALAQVLYERALRIDEAAFGPDHPKVAGDVNNLGGVVEAQGDLPTARAYLERALHIFEQHLGDSHPNVATLVNNLGSVVQAQGDLPTARAYLERALHIFEQHLGDSHPNVATLVNNLGSVVQAQGDLPAARTYLERALRIDEATFGPDHPKVAIRLNNLGSVMQAQGDLPAARTYLERALRIDEAAFGPDHPNVAIRVNNLGLVSKNQGDLPAARALYERALRILEQKLGLEHPNTRIVHGNLAAVLAALGGLTQE